MDDRRRPRLRQRLLIATTTSLVGVPIFFVSFFSLLAVNPGLLAIGEPVASVAIYGCSFGLSGMACLVLNRLWLKRSWSATVATMIGPYLLLVGVLLAAGAVHLALSSALERPNTFMPWFSLYATLAFGALGAIVIACVVWLSGRVVVFIEFVTTSLRS